MFEALDAIGLHQLCGLM